ncbi:MAG: helix-turn-helix transcriptional regulator [Bifidobacterium mongoliense]|jgi:transcriptional regulator with XRE-family HTH domain|uniref:helix-turn-helix transcriptional regulator n=1 Tax=Bifidobacterium mongoliense TaxID=518643 RepID=UPI002F358C0D
MKPEFSIEKNIAQAERQFDAYRKLVTALKRRRESLGLTREDLAFRCGLPVEQIRLTEEGISMPIMLKYIIAVGATVEFSIKEEA